MCHYCLVPGPLWQNDNIQDVTSKKLAVRHKAVFRFELCLILQVLRASQATMIDPRLPIGFPAKNCCQFWFLATSKCDKPMPCGVDTFLKSLGFPGQKPGNLTRGGAWDLVDGAYRVKLAKRLWNRDAKAGKQKAAPKKVTCPQCKHEAGICR